MDIISQAVGGIAEAMAGEPYERSLLIARATLAQDLINDIVGVGEQYIASHQPQPAIFAVQNKIVDMKGNPIGG